MCDERHDGDGDGRRRDPRGARAWRPRGQARVGLAYARNLVGRSTGCWVAYLVAWLLVTVFPLVLLASSPYDHRGTMPYAWQVEYVVALLGCAIGAIAAAVRVSGCAFRRAEADFAGSLPLRRPALFASTALAGLVPLLAVEALVALVLVVLSAFMPLIEAGACGQWLALAAVFTFVFYATALLCVQLSGTVSATVWLFLGANFFIVVVELVARFLAGYLVWGLDMGAGAVLDWTSPPLGMGSRGLTGSFGLGADIANGIEPYPGVTVSSGLSLGADWGVLGLYCAAGAVFCLLAFLLNGVRPLERAGETLPYRWLRVVFTCAGGLIGALVLGLVAAGLAANAFGAPLALPEGIAVAVCLGIGGFLGAVFAAAYVHGSAGRFRAPVKLAAGIGAAALVLGLACALDVLGIESRVPEAADVKDVRVEVSNPTERSSFALPENVAGVTEAQRQVLGLEDDARQARDADEQTTVSFAYTLANGQTLRRSYTIPMEGKEERALLVGLSGVFNTREGVDSRLGAIWKTRARDLEVDYDPNDGGDGDAYSLSDKQAREFVTGPLAEDARGHGALDVDLTTTVTDYHGRGFVSIQYGSAENSTVLDIPVSKKGTPAIYRWARVHSR